MRYLVISAVLLALIPACQHEAQQSIAPPATRAVETSPAWNGARPLDWEYEQRVAEAKRQGKWPPLKPRKYRVYLFQDRRWKVLATIDSFDSADALRRAVQFVPEDAYDQPIAVLPAEEGIPPLDPKLAY